MSYLTRLEPGMFVDSKHRTIITIKGGWYIPYLPLEGAAKDSLVDKDIFHKELQKFLEKWFPNSDELEHLHHTDENFVIHKHTNL